MALGPRRPLVDNTDAANEEDCAPRMLSRPADPPPLLGHAAQMDSVRDFRREFSAQLQMSQAPRLGSLKASMRAWAGRVSGRADRRLLFTVARATDALANHCDALADRLMSLEALSSDVTAAYGEDITRLRAEVVHLRSLAASLERPRSE